MALEKKDPLKVIPASSITVIQKKKPQKILDEDTYTKDVEHIIEEDFFPDLPDLKSKAEYFEALEKNDLVKLRKFQLKFTGGRPATNRTDCNSPATFETPDIRQNDGPTSEKIDEEKNKEEKDETSNKKQPKLSLDAYMSKNTSEDNASFAEILEETQKQHREKHAWLFENESSRKQEEENRLALPSIEQQAAIEAPQAGVDTWKYQARNNLMYVPDGADFSAQEIIDAQQKKPRKIVHENTRFTHCPWNKNKNQALIKEAASAKAIINQGKIGHDGKEILPAESPRVNGYGFVGTPSPAPGVDESPLMTWGEIESTPFRLEGGETPLIGSGPAFKIPEIPKRDQLAMDLAEKASKSHRDKKEKALRSVQARLASPFSPKFGRSTSDRISSMSPAAQRLAHSRLGIRSNTDKALRASYTPSPSNRLPGDKTPISLTPSRTPKNGTPSAVRTPGSKREGGDVQSLTDNLLQLPKRPKAADFF
ncbi:splicing factor ESS-2 homolog [Saccostrea echinata]|uniref:splicing factor ESS-2 homolog n=1 Tax=Saccostrea echinata TaxID=191078 RepID=UPI002A8419B5|nr:splicing factor ESS-2 homolog [Saccostrea echinata]